MTRKEISLVIKAFYDINAVVRVSYDPHSAFRYAHTNEYLDRILERYNELKQKKK